MAEIKLNNQTENKAQIGQDVIRITYRGMMICPNGYELIKADETHYRCTGGKHIYEIDTQSMRVDKNGDLFIIPKSAQTKGEE